MGIDNHSAEVDPLLVPALDYGTNSGEPLDRHVRLDNRLLMYSSPCSTLIRGRETASFLTMCHRTSVAWVSCTMCIMHSKEC
jgi:hypothetical protein